MNFRELKTGLVAALILIAVNVGSWAWLSKDRAKAEVRPAPQGTYMQAYDFNLY